MIEKLQLRKDFYQLPKKIEEERQKRAKDEVNDKKKLTAF